MDQQVDDWQDYLREAFDIFDKNKNDNISVDELSSVFRSLGYDFSIKDIDRMVKQYKDTQELTFDDFKQLLLLQEEKARSNEDDLRDAFEVFDRDANGFITLDELMIVTKSLGERISKEDLKEMIKFASGNNGDQVSLKQFVEVYLVFIYTISRNDVLELRIFLHIYII